MRTPLMVRSGPVYHCLKKFKKIYIEITNRCNLACSFCHRSLRSTDLHNPMHAALEEHFNLPIRLNQIPGGRGIAMAPKIYLSRAQGFTWPHQPGPDQGARGTCRGLKDHIAILVDGTVVPCCLDGEGDIALGNIISEPLPEILSSPRATAMRLAANRQLFVEPLCRRCTYRKRFEHASAPESTDHAFLAADNECSAPLRDYGR